MTRAFVFSTVAALAACAGGQNAAIPPLANATSPVATQRMDGNSVFNISKEETRYTGILASGVEDAALAVHAAFAKIGLPVQTLSRDPRVIGNERVALRRALNGRPLAEYFDCGITNNGVLANVYRLQAAALMSVVPAGADSARLEVRITAQAFSNEGASGGGVDCSTRGTLEKLLLAEAGVTSVRRKR